eukprot:g4776.t1
MNYSFRQRLEASMEEVKRILSTERNPVLAENVEHTYDDKYNLAAWTTSLGAMGALNILEKLGFTQPQLELAKQYKKEGKSVTVRLHGSAECESLGKEEKTVKSGSQVVKQTNSLFGSSKTTTSVSTKVDVYSWKYTSNWEVCMFPRTSFPEEKTVLLARTGSIVVQVTGSSQPPGPKTKTLPYIDLSLDWFLSLLNDSGSLEFKIDRSSDTCLTPSRNEDVKKAETFFAGLSLWCRGAKSLVQDVIRVEERALKAREEPASGWSSLILKQEGLFVPILPIMESGTNRPGPMLDSNDSHKFLERQAGGIVKALAALQGEHKVPSPEDGKLVSVAEITLGLMSTHAENLCAAFQGALNYIESMLYVQLESAVGKTVRYAEFQEYMRYHNSQLFVPEYAPKPFCYSIRRPGRYPEGTLTIESVNSSDESKNAPVPTTVREAPEAIPMQFSLDAATKVTFGGRRFLHSMVRHTFRSSAEKIQLVARARQFSSYILLIGTLASKDEFSPTDAIIVKNKDKLTLELLLETIPTAKEFKDAISSLSPEQQRFAKSFRNMQLAGTLFSVCIIQIKPQLERLLNLPSGSLTKEIKLTENLMDLFVKYQIPSDLMSYDEDLPAGPAAEDSAAAAPSLSGNVALEQVRSHVQRMNDMLDGMKQEEVKESAYGSVHRSLEGDCWDDSESDNEVMESAPMMPQMAAMMRMGAAPPPAPAGGGGGARRLKAKKSSAPRRANRRVEGASLERQKEHLVETEQTNASDGVDDGNSETVGIFDDMTKIPKVLDSTYEKLDPNAPLRPTKIKVGDVWTLSSQPSILDRKATTERLSAERRKTEKSRAFDLLDALSKSGCISIEHAELHVIVACTHCFKRTVVDTVIQGNANPIEEIERSILIVASTIQEKSTAELVNDRAVPALQAHSPMLFLQQ